MLSPKSAEDARKLVAEDQAMKVDIVKIRVDDNLGATPKMAPEIYKAVIDQAHKKGLRVAVHLFYLDDAKAVLDAGADFIAHSVRDTAVDDQFIAMLKLTACVVGNSSAGIKECSYLGTPVVNIGGRQQGRLNADNVVDAGYDAREIQRVVQAQVRHGRYAPSHIYYQPDASQTIVDVLARVELYTQKRFHDAVPATTSTP